MTLKPMPNVLADWLDHLAEEGKSRHTIAAYRRAVQHFIRWNRETFNTPFQPSSFIPRDVRDWKTYQLTVEKVKPSTFNQRLTGLSRFFTWARDAGIVERDPTESVQTVRIDNRDVKSISGTALRLLRRKVSDEKNKRDIAIIEVLAGTGIRVGELLAMQVGDVELKPRSGTLTVRESKHGQHRTIPLTKEVRHALRAYLMKHPTNDEGDAPLWLSSYGPLSHRSSILRILRKYARLAGIDEEVSPHRLRHTFATNYLAANPDDLRGLAALLGHSSLETVMIYTQPTTDDLAVRMARAEQHSTRLSEQADDDEVQ